MNSRAIAGAILAGALIVGAGFWWIARDLDKAPKRIEAYEDSHAADARDEAAVEAGPREASLPFDVPERAADAREDSDSDPVRGSGTITVAVVDRDGRQVAGAEVMLERVNWEEYEEPGDDHVRLAGVSGSDGKAAFERLPDGSYAARARTKSGAQSGTASLSERWREAEIVLELWDSLPTSGMVTNTAGEGIAGAVVHVYETDHFPGQILSTSRSTSARVYTNERGRFEFPQLWTGKWRLYAKADGYASAVTDWFEAGLSNLNIVLGEGGSVSGIVLDERTDTGLPNIEVQVTSEYPRDRHVMRSDVDGAFTIEGVREGEYPLTVTDADLVPVGDPPKVTIQDGRTTSGVKLIVTPGAIVAGRVYEKGSGTGIAGAEVYVGGKQTQTSRDGTFEARGLAKGSHEVQLREVPGFSNRNFYETRKTLSVEPGQVIENVDFELDKGITISGRVIDSEGSGIEGARVNGRSMRGNVYSNTESNSFGGFELTGFQPMQEIFLSASNEGLAPQSIEAVNITDQSVTGIEIVMVGEASISGTIVDGEGKPLVGAGVHGRLGENWIGGGSTASEAAGAFTLGGLTEGEYRLYASRDRGGPYGGGAPLEVITVKAGQHIEGIRLALSVSGKSGTIAGRITNTRDEGIAGVNVQGYDREGAWLNTRTGADGQYTLRDAPEGQIQLQLDHPQYTSANFTASTGDRNADFTMDGRGTLEGRVVDAATGEPIDQFQVMSYPYDEHTLRNNLENVDGQLQTFHNENGEFTLRIEAKTNTLYARAEGYARTIEPIVGVADQTISDVELRLQRAAMVEGIVLSPKGAPVFGARVFEGNVPDEWRREQGAIAVTDRDGRFEVSNLSPETVTISAYHAHYAPGSATVVLRSSSVTQVEIVLPVGAGVEGRVLVGGRVPTGVMTSVYVSPRNGVGQSALVESDGSYSVSGLAPGDVSVGATLNADRAAGLYSRNLSKEVVLRDGFVTTVDFNFPVADATIEGYLTFNGQPVSQGWINAAFESSDGGYENANGQSDTNGYYRIEGVLSEVQVSLNAGAQVGDRNLSRVARVQVGSGAVERVDFDFSGGLRLTGFVDGMDAGWRGSVMVLTGDSDIEDIDWQDQTVWQELNACCMVSAGEVKGDGSFVVEGLEPGRYRVVALVFDEGLTNNQEAMIASMRRGVGEVEVVAGREGSVRLRVE